jgi:ATP synthase protein I
MTRDTEQEELAQKITKGRKAQLLVIFVIALLFAIRDINHAGAAIYGGVLSLVVSLTLSFAVLKATDVSKSDPKTAMGILYVSAVIRFILILVLFAIGIGWLGFNPIPLVVTAIAAWLTGIIASR